MPRRPSYPRTSLAPWKQGLWCPRGPFQKEISSSKQLFFRGYVAFQVEYGIFPKKFKIVISKKNYTLNKTQPSKSSPSVNLILYIRWIFLDKILLSNFWAGWNKVCKVLWWSPIYRKRDVIGLTNLSISSQGQLSHPAGFSKGIKPPLPQATWKNCGTQSGGLKNCWWYLIVCSVFGSFWWTTGPGWNRKLVPTKKTHGNERIYLN